MDGVLMTFRQVRRKGARLHMRGNAARSDCQLSGNPSWAETPTLRHGHQSEPCLIPIPFPVFQMDLSLVCGRDDAASPRSAPSTGNSAAPREVPAQRNARRPADATCQCRPNFPADEPLSKNELLHRPEIYC